MFLDLFFEKTKFKEMNIDLKNFNIDSPKSNKEDQFQDEDEILRLFGYEVKDIKSKYYKIFDTSEILKHASDLKHAISGSFDYYAEYNGISDFIKGKKKLEDINTFFFQKEGIKDLLKDPKIVNQLKKDFNKAKSISDHYKSLRNLVEKKTGLKWESIEAGFNHIKRYRSMSGRKMDEKIFPFLHALTVKNKKLPKKVYRGLYIDGEKFQKLKDKDDYKIGNKIKLNNKRATSWSLSKGTAYMFSMDHDDIKDVENGVSIIVSYEIQNESDVIANFMNIPKEFPFFNQQEILISKDVKYGTIEDIKFGEAIDNTDKTKFGDDFFSLTFMEYIKSIFDKKSNNLPPNLKISLKEIFNLDVKTFKEKSFSYDLKNGGLGYLLRTNEFDNFNLIWTLLMDEYYLMTYEQYAIEKWTKDYIIIKTNEKTVFSPLGLEENDIKAKIKMTNKVLLPNKMEIDLEILEYESSKFSKEDFIKNIKNSGYVLKNMNLKTDSKVKINIKN